ncbi:MAG: GNAT family N-acetyltransferase [Bacteroidales bacterium]|nr:GNAT family N-acetyltransferase [Bacteroidales bacterium]MCF8388404.1 GNAT family N-acetyltransferase [Bacteroidales bacterium]MCF8398269.1 GNAT family N-acetyltransferase [Bacteroidales bacterium]
MINIDKLKFIQLDYHGLQTLVKWAEKEGWNPGPNDAEVFWVTDPEGYYGFFLEDEMIGGGSIVSYDGDFGFMGFFIMKPEYRSRGIGRELWYLRRDKLISRLKPGAPIGMDGVVDMQPFYRKGGFELAFRDERHERMGETFDIDPHVSPIVEQDFESIVLYDKQGFGYYRPQFLKPWLNMPEAKTFKYVKDNTLEGYAVMRKAGIGYKIGPLFADNAQTAEELYKACLNAFPGEKVYLDIPMKNPEAVALAKKYKTAYSFECARMYYGNPPDVELNKIFGVTTFELG